MTAILKIDPFRCVSTTLYLDILEISHYFSELKRIYHILMSFFIPFLSCYCSEHLLLASFISYYLFTSFGLNNNDKTLVCWLNPGLILFEKIVAHTLFNVFFIFKQNATSKIPYRLEILRRAFSIDEDISQTDWKISALKPNKIENQIYTWFQLQLGLLFLKNVIPWDHSVGD